MNHSFQHTLVGISNTCLKVNSFVSVFKVLLDFQVVLFS